MMLVRPKQFVRRGHTLTEVVIVISIMSMLLTMSVLLMTKLIHIDTAGRRTMTDSLVAGQLADQFRRDIHAVTEVDSILLSDASLDLLVSTKRTIRYQHQDGTVIRQVLDTAVEPNVISRESYALSSADHVAWAMVTHHGVPFVQLTIISQERPDRPEKVLLHVIAEPNLATHESSK
ncbi:MAG: prepilin-type N-terminal cleavage/methylation domain-containing protein [Pirellulaceae bacterium]